MCREHHVITQVTGLVFRLRVGLTLLQPSHTRFSSASISPGSPPLSAPPSPPPLAHYLRIVALTRQQCCCLLLAACCLLLAVRLRLIHRHDETLTCCMHLCLHVSCTRAYMLHAHVLTCCMHTCLHVAFTQCDACTPTGTRAVDTGIRAVAGAQSQRLAHVRRKPEVELSSRAAEPPPVCTNARHRSYPRDFFTSEARVD